MSTPYALGALASPPDERDRQVQAFLPTATPALPNAWNFEGIMGPVRDQGQEGTCVAFALAAGVMAYDEHTRPSAAAPLLRLLSPRAAYQGARQGVIGGSGCWPRQALDYVLKNGLPLEADWPYIANQPGQAGPQAATHAPLNKLSGYASVALTTEALKAALYHLGPFLTVIHVFDGFWTPDAAGLVQATGKDNGLHGVCLVGWDDTRQAWRLRNSWGDGWGQGGYCWLPFTYPLVEAWSSVPALLAGGTPPTPPSEPWWWAIAHLFHLA
jgi:C1A family cysteine protease